MLISSDGWVARFDFGPRRTRRPFGAQFVLLAGKYMFLPALTHASQRNLVGCSGMLTFMFTCTHTWCHLSFTFCCMMESGLQMITIMTCFSESETITEATAVLMKNVGARSGKHQQNTPKVHLLLWRNSDQLHNTLILMRPHALWWKLWWNRNFWPLYTFVVLQKYGPWMNCCEVARNAAKTAPWCHTGPCLWWQPVAGSFSSGESVLLLALRCYVDAMCVVLCYAPGRKKSPSKSKSPSRFGRTLVQSVETESGSSRAVPGLGLSSCRLFSP